MVQNGPCLYKGQNKSPSDVKHLMNNTTNILNEFFRGRPSVPVDGDIAALEEQTVSCLEAHSINCMNSPDGTPKNGLGVLTPNETTRDIDSQLGEDPPTGRSSVLTDVTVENTNSIIRVERIMEEMAIKKKKIWSGIGRKQGLRIATLNVNGRRDEKKRDKWPNLVNLVRSNGIAILGLQESHLDIEETEMLNDRFQKVITMNNGISTSKEGVTFVLNKEMVNGMKWNHTPLVEGRASRLQIETEKERELNIILVYAPNEEREKTAFWKLLRTRLKGEKDLENVIIMGDFNFVENALDRYPHRDDDANVLSSWKALRDKYKLTDGWRAQNPIKKDYTYVQKATNSMSRIDRIYMDSEIYVYGYNWTHIESSLSDHNMVMTDILKTKIPFIGKGVWRMYSDDIENKVTIKKITKLLKITEEKFTSIKENKTEGSIQRVWAEVKTEIKAIAMEERKKKSQQLNKEKEKLKKGIERRMEKLSDEMDDISKRYQNEIAELKAKLMMKTKNDLTKMRLATRARYRQNGEKCTKYWFGLNKEKMDETTIIALLGPNSKMTRETREMGEIAVKHHETLQTKPMMTEDRKEAIVELEAIIEGKCITNEQKQRLIKKTSRDEVEEAIKSTATGTSPGIDGIPYELYKEIIKIEKKKKKEERVDVVGIIQDLINNIEEIGIEKLSTEDKKENEFTDGLMFLLYKKKEKWKIENYRPITLLNTDYKIYTKTIAKRLADVAPTIVHEDQAGFIPKRSLYDHTRTTQMVIEYCEIAEEDGCIVALDQEKAYDKIDHEYLWRILKKYGFPDEFIKRIQELYKNTNKAIMINGTVTKKYKVGRGVHQGDPMSCILYDLAIEPLAEALRKSNLKGLEIEGNIERLVVNLFADDTIVYLRKDDNMEVLDKVLNTFCKASTAKFNVNKTEILPIGKAGFRREMIENRRMGINIINGDKKIIKEGESMRTLGSWVGNGKTDSPQWEKIIKSQERIIEKWSRMNLTTKGKELALKSLIQSKAVFLATVNGMPTKVEDEMKKMYHKFLWNEKPKGLMKWEQVIAKRSQGGLGMPDIAARVEAIEVMWLKKWLSPANERPRWANIMDMILNKSIAKQPMIDQESRISWIMQAWHESEARNTKLSDNIRRMLKTARKYNISPMAPKYNKEAKESQPLWHNIMMKNANYLWNKKSARCLRQNHDVKTIGDLIEWNKLKNCTSACNKMVERLMSMIPMKINPLEMTPKKVKRANLDLTPKRLRKNKENKDKKTFNPDITIKERWEGAIRLFAAEKGPKTRRIKKVIKEANPAYREEPGKGNIEAIIVTVTKNRNKDNESIIIIIRIKDRKTKEKRIIMFSVIDELENLDKIRAMTLLKILKESKGCDLRIRTNDKRMVTWIGEKLEQAEEDGWLNTENSELWKMVLGNLRKRGNKTVICRVRKKSKTINKMEELKKEAETEENINQLKIKIRKESNFDRAGAALRKMTQKKAYDLIIKKKSEKPGGLRTITNMEKIKETMIQRRKRVTEKEIWKSLKKIDNPNIADFIWKIIHGRIKCGPFFRNIPNWQEKEFCTCGASETIEHIIFSCKESGQEELWKIVEEQLMLETGTRMGEMHIGVLMGTGMLEAERSKKITHKAATDLLRKIICITTWVIWKERNDRVFNEKEVSKDRLKKKWEEEVRKEIRIDLWEKWNEKERKRKRRMWTTNGTFAEIKKEDDGKEVINIKIGIENDL